jgi:hypothetical protein
LTYMYAINCHVMFATVASARLISDVLSSRCMRDAGVIIVANVVTIAGIIVALSQLKDQVYMQLTTGRSLIGIYLRAATLYCVGYVIIRAVLVQKRYVARPWYDMRLSAGLC